MIFRRADRGDIKSLKKLWLDCFEENPRAVDLLFDYWGEFSAFCAECEGKIASALYLWHGRLNGERAHYLFGAATHPDFRGRKIMSGLIEFSLEAARHNGDKFSLLLPASEGLYSFYSRFGYIANGCKKVTEFKRAELEKAAGIPEKKPDLSDCFLQDKKLFEFAKAYYGVYGIKNICSDGCFALYSEENGCADVFYSAYSDFSALGTLLLQNSSSEKFVFTEKADNQKCGLKSGMIKPLDKNLKVPENVYIGITFE